METINQEEKIRVEILKHIIESTPEVKTEWLQKYKILYPTRDIEADVIEYLNNTSTQKPRSSFESIMDSFLSGAREAKNSFVDDLNLAAEKIKKLEDPANDVIDKTLGTVAKTGSELLNKAKEKYQQFSNTASNAKFEDELFNNFDEDKFVTAVLNNEIVFTQSKSDKFDFLDFKGVQHKWTSKNEYFSLVVDERNKVYFKFNNIDYRQLMRRVDVMSLPRIYNAIVYGNDSTEIVDPALKF